MGLKNERPQFGQVGGASCPTFSVGHGSPNRTSIPTHLEATSVYSFILLNHTGFSPKNKKQENDLSLAYPEYISIKQEESQAWVEIEIPSLKPIKV